MSDKPNDRPKSQANKNGESEPAIYQIIDGKKFIKPGLETYFAGEGEGESGGNKIAGGCSCHPVKETYCACNKVTTCTCFRHESNSGGGGSYGGRVCRCAPVS